MMEMPRQIFRFKKFEVVNERSAMKVNTDGVLLGALMTVKPTDRRLLDIGTGTGTIALMAAQRLTEAAGITASGCMEGFPQMDKCSIPVLIQAIDIDEPSVTEASENFRNSPWGDILRAHHSSLESFASEVDDECAEEGYDLIFSNPPYFDNALQAPEQRRNSARHTSTGLSYREILEFSARHLAQDGRVAVVLPAAAEHDLTRCARMNGLHLHKIFRIRTVPRKEPKLIVAEFSRHRADIPQDTVVTIQNEGQYTQEYLSLMKDFYLFA